MALNFNRYYRRPDGRFFYTPTFMPVHYDKKEWVKADHPILKRLASLRPGFILLWSRTIKRYVLYRLVVEAKSLVHIHTCDQPRPDGSMAYREPGEWLYTLLRRTDLTKGGTTKIKEAQEKFDKKITKIHPLIIEHNRRYAEMMYNMNLEFEIYLKRGRTSFILGRGGSASAKPTAKTKEKKAVFMNVKTGQIVNDPAKLPLSAQIGFGFKKVGQGENNA